MTKNSFFLGRTLGLIFLTVISASPSPGAVFHVTNAAELQNALTTAQSNGQDDTIYLAAGTYIGNFTYLPPDTEHKSLNMKGESGTVPDEIILDGQNSGRVLYLHDYNSGTDAEIRIEGITAQNGSSNSYGGGISANLYAYNITIINCRIRNNTSRGYGGGVYLENHGGTIKLENNLILGNRTVEGPEKVSRGGGASIFSSSSTYIVRNNVIARNASQGTHDPQGGGLWLGWTTDETIHLVNNTLFDNQANKGGGVYFNKAGTVHIYNNVIYGNIAVEGGDIYWGSVTSKAGYNNNYSTMFGTWTTSGGNLNTDPLFVDPVNGDFHVQSGSPMINAGTAAVPSPPGLPSTDFDGNPRACGPAPDIGAYETLEIYPGQGTVGTEVSIPGSGYGTRRNRVLLGTYSLKILLWTDNLIRASLGKALPSGLYDITIQPKGTSSILFEGAFTVEVPEIGSFEPGTGSINEEITMYGFFFGNKRGKVTLEGKNCRIKAWTMNPMTGESEVHFVVPGGLSAGTHELKITNGVGSDTTTFIVE